MLDMKKFILFLIIFIAVSNFIYGQNVKNRAIKRGLILNTSIGINTTKAGLQTPNIKWDELSHFNLQFGTRWYIKPQKQWAIGIQTSWFDISYLESTSLTTQEYNYDDDIFDTGGITNKLFAVSFFTVGPVGTYAITPNIAIDGYYNIRPTFVQANVSGTGDQPGFGVSHLFGFAFRVGVSNIAIEYIFGEIKPFTDIISDAVEDIGENVTTQNVGKIKTNELRLSVGLKF